MSFIVITFKIFLILFMLTFRRIYAFHKRNHISNQNKWAVLIAGSTEWENYRHQADVCHAYHIVRRHGIPRENIITMMYDDIARNERNPFPGKIFNKPGGPNVYKGVHIDYRGKDVSVQNFLNVLLGNAEGMKGIGSGKVLKSGPNDHVFIYFTDHGDVGLIQLPDWFITYHQLLKALENMKNKNMYRKLLFFMEACHSGSMFQQLPKNISIYATTAADAHQSSYSIYCEEKNLPCLGDQYSISWMESINYNDINYMTLDHQFEIVKKLTFTTSTVQKFGDYNIGSMTVADFIGNKPNHRKHHEKKKHYDKEVTIPSREADFHYLHKQLNETTPGSTKQKHVAESISKLFLDMKFVKEKTKLIVTILTGTENDANEVLNTKSLPEKQHGECFHNAMNILIKECYKTETQREHGLHHSQKILNLCSQPQLSQEGIINAIKNACNEVEKDEVVIDEDEECWMGQSLCNIFCTAKGVHNNEKMRGQCINEKCLCN
ncbi:legumain-like [Lycorma delicatula]|uniref:legumain-like n=1 Tax=Lycorma delicatula TaxID=130591 RepID=UPI003F514D58